MAAIVGASAALSGSKHSGNRDAFGGRQRNRPNRLSEKAYAMRAAFLLQLRRAPGSQATHREMRKRAADSLGMSVEMYRDIARSNGPWIGREA
jgi:hypothetical protein